MEEINKKELVEKFNQLPSEERVAMFVRSAKRFLTENEQMEFIRDTVILCQPPMYFSIPEKATRGSLIAVLCYSLVGQYCVIVSHATNKSFVQQFMFPAMEKSGKECIEHALNECEVLLQEIANFE
ncbi:MAG TPA: hypothetical protein PLJ00_15785 [Chitinophagales bacterium]|nr:hypothetical protein [Chitinophagales bacterium]